MASLIMFGNVTSKPEIFNFKTKNKQDFHVKTGKYGATQTMEVKSSYIHLHHLQMESRIREER
jgi:hypothetical protein